MNLAGEQYETKQAAGERIRGILYAAPVGRPIVGRDGEVLRALLERHPRSVEKIGPGVLWFEVRMNPEHPSQRSFWLVRVDGTQSDWSYLRCLNLRDQRALVLEAMRAAVVEQILAFKNAQFEQGTVTCAITGEPVSRDNCHVDHAPPTFVALAETFAASYGGFEEIRVSAGTDGAIGRRLTDEHQCHSWQYFHRQQARLRIVTRLANLSLLRRKSTSSVV